MTMPVDLVFVRHGESEGNIAMRAARRGDDSRFTPEFLARHSGRWRLTEEGRAQAVAAGEWLQQHMPDPFGRHLVSDYARARETAALLDRADAQWHVTVDLRERDYGAMDAITNADGEGRFADDLLRRAMSEFYWRPPRGESIAQMQARLRWVLDSLHRESADKRVIIVCHGEVIRAFQMLLERLTVKRWEELEESRNPHDKINNCQILHYTRRVEGSDAVTPYLNAVRSICPWDESLSSGQWQAITRKTFSNEDLLRSIQ